MYPLPQLLFPARPEAMAGKPRIVITYCTQCQWLLRAGWMAQ